MQKNRWIIVLADNLDVYLKEGNRYFKLQEFYRNLYRASILVIIASFILAAPINAMETGIDKDFSKWAIGTDLMYLPDTEHQFTLENVLSQPGWEASEAGI